MKAVTVRQPWASLIAAGVKTIETRPRRTSYRGRIAIHTGAQRFDEAAIVALPEVHDALWPALGFTTRPMPGTVRARLPRGAVVASAVLTDCAPIGGPYDFRTGYAEGDEGDYPGQAVVVSHPDYGHGAALVLSNADTSSTDITDQLPFSDWSPGRWALLLDDIKPTTERCPYCWGDCECCPKIMDGSTRRVRSCVFCPACNGIGKCDPVPARGQQAVPWEWTPEKS